MTTSDGVEIAFDVQGGGRDIVWLHGLCERRQAWTPITDRLSADFRCIRVDFRGHGDSGHLSEYDAGGFLNDVAAVIGQACPYPPIVIGHSLGGVIATASSALGLTGPVVCIDQPLRMGTFAALVLPLADRLRSPDTFADALMEEKIALGMGLVPQPMFAELELATRTSDQLVVLGTWKFMLDGDPEVLRENDAALAAILPAISAPYLALHGTPVDAGYENWLQATIPGAEWEIWPELGHWLHLVAPDRFLERIAPFLARTSL